MNPKPYPEEKRRILVERDQEDFIRFLENITDEMGQEFVQDMLLPAKMDGYRKGHIPFKLRVGKLHSALKRSKELTSSESPLWNMVGTAWVYWITSHACLKRILDEFANDEDFDEQGRCVALPNSELDTQCFKILQAASRDYQIDRETIQDFYEYGYFRSSGEIESLIAQAVSRDEIERQQRLAALPEQVAALSKTVESLGSQLSETGSIEEKKEEKLNQQIENIGRSLGKQLSDTYSTLIEQVSDLQQSVDALRLRIAEDTESLHTRISENQSVCEQTAEQLSQQIQDVIRSFMAKQSPGERDLTDSDVEQDEVIQTTEQPRIAYQALQIRKCYAERIEGKERFEDENEYLSDFSYCLRRFGLIDSDKQDEVAIALHIALKAFPAIELADPRLLEVWRLTCGDSLYITTVDVEMGWLGLQDWFPELFSEECFGEQLRRIDLAASIRRMLNTGDMLWAIHLRNSDRSFPESYLPRFSDWLGSTAGPSAKVLLTRCTGSNHCELGPESYTYMARLPNPHTPEPIEAQNLRASDVVVTGPDWETWCYPRASQVASQSLDLLEQLRLAFSLAKVDIPTQILREILRYQLLTHDVMTPTKALDWGLTLRLSPWIGSRSELIEATQSLIRDSDLELLRFQEALAKAQEESS